MRTLPNCENSALPFWDSTLDSYLTLFSDSVMFCDPTYMGNCKGTVNTGFLKDFGNVVPNYCRMYGVPLSRDCDFGCMLTDEKVQRWLDCEGYQPCVTPWDSTIEDDHGLVHFCVGAHMNDLLCAPNDPLFWMHHTYLDYVFDVYLKRHFQDRGKTRPRPTPEGWEGTWVPMRTCNHSIIISTRSRTA